jgi:ribosomal protein S18 acetylase RimI-like enzyme
MRVYKNKENIFYNTCKVVCKDSKIVGTCFLWKLNDKINTVHWFKVKKEYENNGIGRALLSYLFKDIKIGDLPIFLHTQPESYRAIKLYTDFGFDIATNEYVGTRKNDIGDSKIYLQQHMPQKDYKQLRYFEIPKQYIEIINEEQINDF